MCVVYSLNAVADDTAIHSEILFKYQTIEELKKEIAQIDSENIRCERMKKGWIAATVVGGVGVVATGTAAIIQGTKLKEMPKKEKKKEDKQETKSGDEAQ